MTATELLPVEQAPGPRPEASDPRPAPDPTARIVRLGFYLFMFSLPFEGAEIKYLDSPTLTKLTGYLVVLTSALQPGISFRVPPRAFWWLVGYVCIYALLGCFQAAEYQDEVLERFITLIQMMGLFWIGCNLLVYDRVVRGALTALIVSCAILAVMQVGDIGTSYEGGVAERQTALGQNANRLAGIFALGLLALVGLVYGRRQSVLRPRALAWPGVALLGFANVLTGSRGGMVALTMGLMAFMLQGDNLRVRVRNLALVGLVLAFVVGITAASETGRRRWTDALEGGNMAKREYLYPAAWQMVQEKPLLGWGPTTHLYELGWRTRHAGWDVPQKWRDTHNLGLWIVTQVGVLGGLPFFVFLGLCLAAAWRARRGPQGVLPLALMFALCCLNMSGTWIYFKLNWLVLAYAVASGGPLALWMAQPGAPAADSQSA
jgi:O-antigen ligase